MTKEQFIEEIVSCFPKIEYYSDSDGFGVNLSRYKCKHNNLDIRMSYDLSWIWILRDGKSIKIPPDVSTIIINKYKNFLYDTEQSKLEELNRSFEETIAGW